MKYYVSGGCKNGKSRFAQEWARNRALAKGKAPLYYVATMIPGDEEDLARIARHVKEREGWGFTTVEQPVSIGKLTEHTDSTGVYLLDSVTALLANEMFGSQEPDLSAPARVAAELKTFLSQVEDAVLVSDFIFGGGFRHDQLTLAYMRGLAAVDRQVAQVCDELVEVSYTNRLYYKGSIER